MHRCLIINTEIQKNVNIEDNLTTYKDHNNTLILDCEKDKIDKIIAKEFKRMIIRTQKHEEENM